MGSVEGSANAAAALPPAQAHGTLYEPPTEERGDKEAAEAEANARFLARMGALELAFDRLGWVK